MESSPPRVFGATIADEKQLHAVKTHHESAFGWVLIGWALGCLLTRGTKSLLLVLYARKTLCN